MGNWRKIVLGILIVVLGVPAVAIIALHSPSVQTSLCRKAASIVSENIEGQVEIGTVSFSFPGLLLLKDVCITQENPQDTVLSVHKIFADARLFALLRGDVIVDKVRLEEGVFRLRNVNDSTTNLSLLLAPFATDKESPEKSFLKTVSVSRVTLKNFDVSRRNPFADTVDKVKENPNRINFNDLDVRDINLDIRHIKYGENASFTIKNISFEEKCGYSLQRFEGEVKLDEEGATVKDFYYQDADSRLQAPVLGLGFDDLSAFDDFMNDIVLNVDIKDLHFDGKTAEHIIGLTMPLLFDASLTLEGPISDIRSNKLKVFSPTQKTFLDLTAHISGLPDITSSLVDINILNCQTNAIDFANVLSSINPAFNKKSISKLAPGETVYFKGSVMGMLDDFVAYGHLKTSSMGEVHMNLMCDNRQNKQVGLEGSLNINKLDIGGILCSEKLGELTCLAAIDGFLGKESFVEIDSMKIATFQFNGYEYKDIRIGGEMTNTKFDGFIFCDDPNLNFTFDGVATFAQDTTQTSKYEFDLNLKNVDLHALNFDKREVSRLSLKADADISITPDGNIRGQTVVSDISSTLPDGEHSLEDIRMRAYVAENRYLLALSSGFAKVRYRGTASIGKFIGDLVNVAGKQNLSHILGEPGKTTPDEYKFTVTTRDMKNICSFFNPGLYVADSTVLDLEMSKAGEVKGLVHSDLLALNSNYIKDINIDITNPESKSLRAAGSISLLQSGDIELKNDTLDVSVANNVVNLQFAFDNKAEKQTMARICAAAEFCDKESAYSIIGSILPSELVLSGFKWDFSPAKIRYSKEEIMLDDFQISSGEQFLKLDGALSADPADTVIFKLNKIDASAVNGLLAGKFKVKGIVDADGLANGVMGEDMGLQMNLAAAGLGINGSEIGDLSAKSVWNAPEKRFDLKARNTLGDKRPLAAAGYYVPSTKSVYLNASFEEFGLTWLEPMLTGLASNLNGSISGDILATGPLDKLEVNSHKTRFNKFGATLDYTKVPYIFDGPFSVTSTGVRFTDVKLYDTYGHSGKVTGTVDYDHFKNIALNVRIKLDNIHALNTKAKDNSSFFGTVFASGSVSLKGPLSLIKIGLRATTEENSSIQIPLGGAGEMKTSMLTFVNNRSQMSVLDSLRQLNKEKEEAKKGGTVLDIDAQITATPLAQIQLVVDPKSGDAVKVRGSGKVDIKIDPVVPMSLNGLYVIDEGIYKLSLLGLVSKDFTINPGSKVTLNGAIMDTDLDLTANYRTKASISTLIADSTSVGNRRFVDCGIKVRNRLENPQINFTIDIPDLDPATQSKVAAALNTEEKRMQQVLALLVSGSFVPDDQSGIVNNTTILYSNASEIMSNQLNKILQRLDIPIDFGFNYQPTDRGTNLFDVAISTQLFNNRVTINGNIGNRQYMSSSRSDVVGDIDVQIKVNKSGDLRFNLFSHSADEYSNFIDQTQRNGAGIVYQKEFDTWKEFIRKTFWSKKRQAEYEEEEQQIIRSEMAKRMRERNLQQQLPTVEPINVPHVD